MWFKLFKNNRPNKSRSIGPRTRPATVSLEVNEKTRFFHTFQTDTTAQHQATIVKSTTKDCCRLTTTSLLILYGRSIAGKMVSHQQEYGTHRTSNSYLINFPVYLIKFTVFCNRNFRISDFDVNYFIFFLSLCTNHALERVNVQK